jgi:hypothetical protein
MPSNGSRWRRFRGSISQEARRWLRLYEKQQAAQHGAGGQLVAYIADEVLSEALRRVTRVDASSVAIADRQHPCQARSPLSSLARATRKFSRGSNVIGGTERCCGSLEGYLVLRNPGVGRDRCGQQRKAMEVNQGGSALFKVSRPHIPGRFGVPNPVAVVMPRAATTRPRVHPVTNLVQLPSGTPSGSPTSRTIGVSPPGLPRRSCRSYAAAPFSHDNPCDLARC